MKHKKLVTFLFAVLLAIIAFSTETKAAEGDIASGVVDEEYGQIIWVINSEGKLKVTGTGDISSSFTFDRAPWYSYSEEIISADIDVIGMTNASYLFNNAKNMTSVDLKDFDTSEITDMRGTFGECSSLKELDVSGFNTARVIDMENMFVGCSSLAKLDVSGFDTANVTNMQGMFWGCSSLKELDVSGFDTANVMDMRGMFNSCSSLASLDVSRFNTARVTDMYGMFGECSSLKELDVSGFNTANVTDMRGMFNSCSSLTSLDVSRFNTARVTDMYGMFGGCRNLTFLDVSGFDTANVTNMGWLFYECSNLKELDVRGFNTENVTDMLNMFAGCSALTELDVSEFDTKNVMRMYSMFGECSSLKELDVNGFDTANVTDMESMFGGCRNLTSLDVSGFDTKYVTSMSYMFYECSSLKELDLSGFSTENVTKMIHMFSGCYSLTSLDVSGFDTANVTNMLAMFNLCGNLKALDVSGFNTVNVADMQGMFSQCYRLKELNMSGFNTEKVTDMGGMFSYCESLKEIDMSSFDMSNVTYADAMFEACNSLEKINTPINCSNSIMLPVESSFYQWSQDAGTAIEELPQKLTESIQIVKNHVGKRTEAPTIELKVDEAGNVTGFSVRNNDEESSMVYYGLATKEEIESGGGSSYFSYELESAEKVEESFEEWISEIVSESGKYYLVAFAYNGKESEDRSELVILEDYPITFTKTHMEEPLKCQIGNTSESLYFTKMSAEVYSKAEAEIFLSNSDHTEEATLKNRDGIWFLNVDDYYFLYYEKCEVKEVAFEKANATANGYVVEQSIYTVLDVEYSLYKEPKAAAPTVTLVEENGTVNGIEIRNNNEEYSILHYGFLTKEQIESGDVRVFYSKELEKDDIYTLSMNEISGIISGSVWFDGPGEYYFMSYAHSDNGARSEVIVLNEYPLTITEGMTDKILVYKAVEEKELVYFLNKEPEGYVNFNVKLQYINEVGDTESQFEGGWMEDGKYLFDLWGNLIGKSWTIEEATFGELIATETGFLLNKSIYNSFVNEKDLPGGVFKEDVSKVFPDIKDNAWYEKSVQYVYDKGLMQGSDGLFHPSDNVTRAQIVTILHRQVGSPKVKDYSACEEFSDVPKGKYYTDAICWAYNEGVTTGKNGIFDRTGNLTRQQMAVFLFRFSEVMGYDTAVRGDYSSMLNAEAVSSYAEDAMQWAVGSGLISGSETKDAQGNIVYDLNPKGNTTRVQMASILMRFCEKNEII